MSSQDILLAILLTYAVVATIAAIVFYVEWGRTIEFCLRRMYDDQEGDDGE